MAGNVEVGMKGNVENNGEKEQKYLDIGSWGCYYNEASDTRAPKSKQNDKF